MNKLATITFAALLSVLPPPVSATDAPAGRFIGTWEVDMDRTLQEIRKSPTFSDAGAQNLSARIAADAERMKIQLTSTNLIKTVGSYDSTISYSVVSSVDTGLTISIHGPDRDVSVVFTLVDGKFMNMTSAEATSDPVSHYIWRKAEPSVYAVPPPSPETVARSFSFPGTITFTDERRKRIDYDNAGKRVWARYFENADHTFASTAVILYEGGTHLSANMRRRLEDGLANFNSQMEKLRQDRLQHGIPDPSKSHAGQAEIEGAPIRIIDLPDKRRGYVYLAGMGPGGGAVAASMPSKDGRYDLLLITTFPGESGRFETSDKTKEYYEALRERPYSSLQQAIIRLDSLMFP